MSKGLWGDGKRLEGRVDGLFIQVQVFTVPSPYGIAQGRISRLAVYPDEHAGEHRVLACYERGWLKRLPEPPIREAIEKAVLHFDHKPVDWNVERQRIITEVLRNE